LEKGDRSTSVVFSDAASATWISNRPLIRVLSESHFSDGSGGNFLHHAVAISGESTYLRMAGADVLLFTRRVVPLEIERVLHQASLSYGDVSFLFLHQASKLVLDGLIDRFSEFRSVPVNIEKIGNTVSSSIPILMSEHIEMVNNSKTILSGFGVGLSTATVALG
jgi:3-oxoacyl-[acyl-carrier-protein] synthase-3